MNINYSENIEKNIEERDKSTERGHVEVEEDLKIMRDIDVETGRNRGSVVENEILLKNDMKKGIYDHDDNDNNNDNKNNKNNNNDNNDDNDNRIDSHGIRMEMRDDDNNTELEAVVRNIELNRDTDLILDEEIDIMKMREYYIEREKNERMNKNVDGYDNEEDIEEEEEEESEWNEEREENEGCDDDDDIYNSDIWLDCESSIEVFDKKNNNYDNNNNNNEMRENDKSYLSYYGRSYDGYSYGNTNGSSKGSGKGSGKSRASRYDISEDDDKNDVIEPIIQKQSKMSTFLRLFGPSSASVVQKSPM